MLSSVSSWFWAKQYDFCQREFPQVYEGFIDHLMDTLLGQGPTAPYRGSQASQEELPLRLPAVPRLVAIGDLHGDFEKTRRAFRAAGLITGDNDTWSGDSTTVVQVGDQLDRGGNEVRILYFLERLQREAAQQGGALHILNGNHETMNVAGRFRYTTPGGMEDFVKWSFLQGMASALKVNCGCQISPAPSPSAASSSQDRQRATIQSRILALAPGGPVARRFLAGHPVVLQVGSTVFVHGGILPQHAAYGLERINAETRAWMAGEAGQEMPAFLGGRDAVVWTRDYSTEDARRCNCAALEEALRMMPGAQRMVVGHTIQEAGINTACGDRVFRIDVGLSQGCGDGAPEVLEILDDTEVRSLREAKEPKSFMPAQTGTAPEGSEQSRAWSWWQKERRKDGEVVSQ